MKTKKMVIATTAMLATVAGIHAQEQRTLAEENKVVVANDNKKEMIPSKEEAQKNWQEKQAITDAEKKDCR